MCTEYNGWTNYETWAVKLWLDNDAGLSEMQTEWAHDARRHASGANRTSEGYLADAVKDFVEEQAPDLGTNVFADLLNSALLSVNWYEIAENILQDGVTEDDNAQDDDDD